MHSLFLQIGVVLVVAGLFCWFIRIVGPDALDGFNSGQNRPCNDSGHITPTVFKSFPYPARRANQRQRRRLMRRVPQIRHYKVGFS